MTYSTVFKELFQCKYTFVVNTLKMRPNSVCTMYATMLMLYVNNEFECFIRGSKHEKTV
jgi:hypothetical protein